jgi:hypothetical protein
MYTKLTPNLTAIITAHGKTKAYLHRFNITESPQCTCKAGPQTVDHLIYECNMIKTERAALLTNPGSMANGEKRTIKETYKAINSVHQFN